ncbi:hypothetical protein ACG83_29715 [Frankia sp. R43]|uniref:nuclear transport factor 2 family protein n=1 Tax=Frankia sp. R43 TaxID=269536 RepID=UPI0006CA529A|nr:nuclear transport factor 2 family protein [Frankia sp. R43]KPM52506.1 hypothetical protein ACG83_29715 [Frankia sp. R43]
MTDEREIDHVIARYVRATDHRDSAAMAALFTTDATVEILDRGPDGPRALDALHGAEAIGQAVAGMMAPHPPFGWTHHTTLNHIVAVDGDDATLDLHFVNYTVQGDAEPRSGWPAGAAGAQGSIRPFESGYVHSRLRRHSDGWKIRHHRIMHDLPFVIAGA